MPSIHIFNPGHETAVLFETLTYTPPANVSVMAKDLAYLPLWYAGQEDLIYVGDHRNDDFTGNLPKEPGPFASVYTPPPEKGRTFHAAPWGISPQILHFFKRLRKEEQLDLIIPEWTNQLKELTGRQSTIKCHRLIRQRNPGLTLPDPPEIIYSVEEAEIFLSKTQLPAVLKTPYSSSGRGILWLRNKTLTSSEKNRIAGAIRKQGFVSLEAGLNKIADFAMEFYSDGKGSVHYEGLSVFNTGEKGAYSGNRLESQESLSAGIDQLAEGKPDRIRHAVTGVIENVYGTQYTGYLGVDMMLYEAGGQILVHPCVEVNMRYTMGLVALRLFERYIHAEAKGNFHVSFDKARGMAFRQHKELAAGHPLTIKEGKISKGYLPLCPVTEETHYRAYIII